MNVQVNYTDICPYGMIHLDICTYQEKMWIVTYPDVCHLKDKACESTAGMLEWLCALTFHLAVQQCDPKWRKRVCSLGLKLMCLWWHSVAEAVPGGFWPCLGHFTLSPSLLLSLLTLSLFFFFALKFWDLYRWHPLCWWYLEIKDIADSGRRWAQVRICLVIECSRVAWQ